MLDTAAPWTSPWLPPGYEHNFWKRHRLNRGGNREANHALWRIVITRMSAHPATRAYVGRRTSEGLTEKEIIRCLKRYVAREACHHLRAGG